MNLKVFVLSGLLATAAFAGHIYTYTATSTKSQEDANNEAMAGVAKQISSQVSATQTLSKEESLVNGNANYRQNYKSNSQVQANVSLKGIKVIPVACDKGYKATASVDLDELTADLQLKIKTIKNEVAKQEAQAKQALNDRHYHNAQKAIETINQLILDHKNILEQLAQIYPVNDAHRLTTEVSSLENKLVDRLSKVRMVGPSKIFEINKPELPSWDVTVFDEFGPLANFPLVAHQGKQVLSERRTQNNGVATFTLRNVNFDNGPFEVSVDANLPIQLLKSAGLQHNLVVSYKVSKAQCFIRLECKQAGNLCNALEGALSKKSIFSNPDADVPTVTAQIFAREKNSVRNLISYDVDIALKGEGINFTTTTTGVGKTELDATIKAVQKTDFSPLVQQVEDFCN